MATDQPEGPPAVDVLASPGAEAVSSTEIRDFNEAWTRETHPIEQAVAAKLQEAEIGDFLLLPEYYDLEIPFVEVVWIDDQPGVRELRTRDPVADPSIPIYVFVVREQFVYSFYEWEGRKFPLMMAWDESYPDHTLDIVDPEQVELE